MKTTVRRILTRRGYADIVQAWPRLPTKTKAAVAAMVRWAARGAFDRHSRRSRHARYAHGGARRGGGG